MASTHYDFQVTIYSGAVRANQAMGSTASGFVTSGRMRSGPGQEFSEGVYAMDLQEGSTQIYSVVAVTQLSKLYQITVSEALAFQLGPIIEFSIKEILSKAAEEDEEQTDITYEPKAKFAAPTVVTFQVEKIQKPEAEEVAYGDSAVVIQFQPPTPTVEITLPPPTTEPPPPEAPPAAPEFTQFPTGGGPEPVLFTEQNDFVNFNIDTNDLDQNGDSVGPIILSNFPVDTSQIEPESVFYDALGGDDIVILPTSANVGIIGYDPSHYFFGNTGNDIIIGNDLNDFISGDEGNDILSGGPGADILVGGPDFDLLSYANDTAGVDIDLSTFSAGDAFGGPSEAAEDIFDGIEGVIGGSGDDRLTGDSENNFFDGGPGIDFIDAGSGNDEIVFDAVDVDDAILGGLGTDTLLFPGGTINIVPDNTNFAGIEIFDLDYDTLLTNLNIDDLNPNDLIGDAPGVVEIFVEGSADNSDNVTFNTVFIGDAPVVVEIFVEGSADNSDNVTFNTVFFGDASTWLNQEGYGEDQSYVEPGYTPIYGIDGNTDMVVAVFQISNNINLNFPQ